MTEAASRADSPSPAALRLRAGIGAGLAGIIVVAPLAVGTVHQGARAAIFLASATLLGLTLVERRMRGNRLPVTLPLVVLAAAFVFTALQLVPLPPGMLALVSPHAHEAFERALGPAAWHAVSLDPAGSWAELAKIGAYAAFYAAASTFASRQPRRELLVNAVVAAAAACAFVGLLQMVFRSPRILFFYTPEQAWPAPMRGTFVNPAHFGALMSLAAPACLTLALVVAPLRVPAMVAAGLAGLGAALSLSRASIVSFVVGLILTLVLHRRLAATAEARRTWARVSAVMAVAMAGVFAIAWGDLAGAWSNVVAATTGPESKARAWAAATGLIGDYPWSGAGRGAFEHAFTRVAESAGRFRMPWIESAYLQVLIDWGLPGGGLLLALTLWGAVASIRRGRSRALLAGPLAGLGALALHDAADFSLELPGVALPALALLAAIHGRRSSESEGGRWRVTVPRAALAAPAALALATLVHLGTPGADADGDRLARAAGDAAVPAAEVAALGRRLHARHPADYFIPLVVGERLAAERRPESLRWLNTAMWLNPRHAGPDLAVAQFLADTGRKAQALVEYRHAAAKVAEPRIEVWPLVLGRYPAVADLLAATPDEVAYLARLGKWLRGLGRAEDAALVDARIVRRDPGHVVALAALAQRAIEAGDAGESASRVEALLKHDRGPDARRLDVRARVLRRDLAGAEQVLDAGIDRSRATFEAEIGLAQALIGAGDLVRARGRLDRIERAWQREPSLWAKLHDARATLERRAGNEHQARWESERRDELLRP